MAEDSTLLINRELLNNIFLKNNRGDLELKENDHTVKPCLRVIKAISDAGGELDKITPSQIVNQLNEIRAQVGKFTKVPPAIFDMNADYFAKNQNKIDNFEANYKEVNNDFKKIQDNTLEMLTNIRTLPGTAQEEKRCIDRIKKVEQSTGIISKTQAQLNEQLDNDLRRAKGQYGGQTIEMQQSPKPGH